MSGPVSSHACCRKGTGVRASGRSLARLRKHPCANQPGVDLFPADALDPASIAKACEGARRRTTSSIP